MYDRGLDTYAQYRYFKKGQSNLLYTPYKMATFNTITHGDLEHLNGWLPSPVAPLFCSPMML